MFLFQILLEEVDQLVEGDDVGLVIEVCMDSVGDNQQLFVVSSQFGEGVLAEVAGAGFFPMNHQNGAANLVRIGQDGLVEEGHTAGYVPTAVGIEIGRAQV